MIKVYKIKGTGQKAVSDLVNIIYGITTDKNGKPVYPDYCRNCKYAKSRYDHSESYCSNERSESYEERVRSWDTSCKLYKKLNKIGNK